LTPEVACRIPYVLSALSSEWRAPLPGPAGHEAQKASGAAKAADADAAAIVQVFMPEGCSPAVLRALVARLGLAAEVDTSGSWELLPRWQTTELRAALQLVQVASMLQIEELLPELIALVRETVTTASDCQQLEMACQHLELPAALSEAAAAVRPTSAPAWLPNEEQVRGMIASALLTADGKVWRVVQKVIDRREGWPKLGRENANILLAFATGVHGSIRAMPHTGFFWGSRDFLYLVCRYVRSRPGDFDAMVSAMFDSVYSMDPELPAEIIDAVFKELLVHEGLSFAQCEHVIAKLMQREDKLEYLFHEWSGLFHALPAHARRALAKGLLPAVGRCPHAALDFVLKELEATPLAPGSDVRSGLCRKRARAAASGAFQGGSCIGCTEMAEGSRIPFTAVLSGVMQRQVRRLDRMTPEARCKETLLVALVLYLAAQWLPWPLLWPQP